MRAVKSGRKTRPDPVRERVQGDLFRSHFLKRLGHIPEGGLENKAIPVGKPLSKSMRDPVPTVIKRFPLNEGENQRSCFSGYNRQGAFLTPCSLRGKDCLIDSCHFPHARVHLLQGTDLFL